MSELTTKNSNNYELLFSDRYTDNNPLYKSRQVTDPLFVFPWKVSKKPLRFGHSSTFKRKYSNNNNYNRELSNYSSSTSDSRRLIKRNPVLKMASSSFNENTTTNSSNNTQSSHTAQGSRSSAENSAPKKSKEEISKAEHELYDRQIRLWGLEAQNRLRNASVLIVGMSGLGAEVAKNLMLCGLKTLTIMDHKNVESNDFTSQFLLSPGSLHENRAVASKQLTQVLNPMVELNVSTEELCGKTDEFYQAFNLVILIDQKYDTINSANKICRKHGIGFQAGGIFGWIGYAFFDFNNQEFLVNKPKQHMVECELDDDDDDLGPSAKKANINGGISVTQINLEDEEDLKVKKKIDFPSFEQAFNVDWSNKRYGRRAKQNVPFTYFTIRTLLRLNNEKEDFTMDELVEAQSKELSRAKRENPEKNDSLKLVLPGPQLNPVSAIVGSFIGQEAIKAISQNDPPLKNLLTYSAIETEAIVIELPPLS